LEAKEGLKAEQMKLPHVLQAGERPGLGAAWLTLMSLLQVPDREPFVGQENHSLCV